MHNHPHLPHEIWLHVAQFVPALVLEGLLSVNGTFYDIAMDCRYRQMSFAFLDSRMLRNVVRLQDPIVAKRVKVLHVYPVFLKQVLDRERDLPLTRRSLRLRFTAFANHFIDQKGRRPKHRKLKTAEDIVQAMLKVFAGLPNVTDYHIMWCGLQPISKSPVPFLATVFRTNLRKLALDISLENVVMLLDPCSAPHSIEELDLVLRVDHPSCSSHATILTHHLAPAVARLQHSLRRLSLQAWEPLDLSPLFHALPRLPSLTHLTLAVPVEYPHLGCPSGLAAFLSRQSTILRSLALRATQYSGAGFTPDPASLTFWLMHALTTTHIPSLKTLDISSPLFPAPAALGALAHFGRTISSLVLTGRYHTHADIVALLALLPRGRLESLRLGSVRLTPAFLDLLAHELPGLTRLELLVREVSPYPDDTEPAAGEIRQETFFTEMEARTYPHWHLRRLKILLTAFPYRFAYGAHIEQLLVRCVPSIRGFA
ncbi:hypothetical protein DXG01_007617 [Tephrocybe rancida]|nr:hypothetical protein DXG01_007617 [Tephrocybe rancida]